MVDVSGIARAAATRQGVQLVHGTLQGWLPSWLAGMRVILGGSRRMASRPSQRVQEDWWLEARHSQCMRGRRKGFHNCDCDRDRDWRVADCQVVRWFFQTRILGRVDCLYQVFL